MSKVLARWRRDEAKLARRIKRGWLEVEGQGQTFDLVTAEVEDERHHWIIADTLALAEAFIGAACAWCGDVRDEILVYHGGDWHKDKGLNRSIQRAPSTTSLCRQDWRGRSK